MSDATLPTPQSILAECERLRKELARSPAYGYMAVEHVENLWRSMELIGDTVPKRHALPTRQEIFRAGLRNDHDDEERAARARILDAIGCVVAWCESRVARIEFVLLPRRRGQSTNKWAVRCKNIASTNLGAVKWFARWHKYAFLPGALPVFLEDQCLRDIADFCQSKTAEHYRQLQKQALGAL